MKILEKILTITIIISGFFLNFIFADDSDCGIFGPMRYKQDGSNGFKMVDTVRETNYEFTKFLDISQQKAIIEKNDLNTALINLKKYCCERELGGLKQSFETCTKDKTFFNDNALDSPYLFDHLFDVIMRRLNGVNGDNNIYTKTKMTLDDKGSERRKRIDKQATSTDGQTPQSIITKYQETRKESPSDLGYNITEYIDNEFTSDNKTFLTFVSGNGGSEDSEKVATALQNYKERTIYDRYINACALSKYFYILLSAGSNYQGDKHTISRIANLSCDKTVKEQIASEKDYTSLVIQKSSNLFLSNYIKGYFSYLYGRQLTLQKLWKDTTDRWFDVANAIPCLQHKCTK